MKVKLRDGEKYFKWGDFVISENEEKETTKTILENSMGRLVPVETDSPKKKPKSKKEVFIDDDSE